MQTVFEVLGCIATIAGLILLFVDIKGKKKISIYAAVCILLGISIIVVCAFWISTPALENSDGSDLHVTTEPDAPNNSTTSTSGTVTNQPNKGEEGTGNDDQILEPLVTVHQVKLDYEELELTVGNATTLSATVMYSNSTNDHSVAWLSSNPSVASVDANCRLEQQQLLHKQVKITRHNPKTVLLLCLILPVNPLDIPSGLAPIMP